MRSIEKPFPWLLLPLWPFLWVWGRLVEKFHVPPFGDAIKYTSHTPLSVVGTPTSGTFTVGVYVNGRSGVSDPIPHDGDFDAAVKQAVARWEQFWELPDDPFDLSEWLGDCEFDDPFVKEMYQNKETCEY